MIILGIETSCDETAAAVLTNNDKRITILSNVISSSAALQEKYGGILPEQAAREQVKMIIPVIEQAINDSRLMINDLDAVAVTQGPGLIGSLLVGVETAKTLALVWNKPLIPVNHLLGHFYANWIENGLSNIVYGISENRNDKRLTINYIPVFPCIGLLVSGGHTDLVLFNGHHDFEYLGGTRDDAAGECFDKCARLLGYPYPGGPKIARLAESAKRAELASQGPTLQTIKLPRPMINSKNLDFSFSGLKTSLSNIVYGISENRNDKRPALPAGRLTINEKRNLAASLEQAIVDVLVTKLTQAVKKYQVNQVIVAGGVAANQKLHSELKKTINDLRLTINLSIPPSNLCTDNAAMIAARAFFESPIDPLLLQADPSLSLHK